MPTNSRISVVGDWTVCQLEWLKDQEESYLEAYAEEQISFFPDLFHRYLALWPVWRTLWPAKPRSRRLSRAERKFVYEAEDYCKSCIRGYFEDRYPHLPPGILALPEVGDWSSRQLQWLEAHQSSFLRSDFHVLWPILLEDFFTIWPVSAFLWPTKPVSCRLTREERRCVLEAKAEFTVAIRLFYDRYLSLQDGGYRTMRE
ncbi:hypothetical protein EDD22DRAFT_963326 [Suillus occidentalis]|nr:hypothetical protein EDD22DRAFT_963326 [Suillus occidentalis]